MHRLVAGACSCRRLSCPAVANHPRLARERAMGPGRGDVGLFGVTLLAPED